MTLDDTPRTDLVTADGERLAGRLVMLCAVLAAALGAALMAASRPALLARFPALLEMRRSGVASLPLASLLIALAGLGGTAILAWARTRASQALPQTGKISGWRGAPRMPARGDARLVGQAARIPQAIVVTIFAVSGAAIAWVLRPASPLPIASAATCYALGGAAILLAFPLLVAERSLAATSARVLPEAASLRALLFIAMLTGFAAGLLQLAVSFSLPYTDRVADSIAILLALIGAELAARALGRLFLPPPAPEAARAAAASLVARVLSGSAAEGGKGGPNGPRFGIDFSRSWALSYVRGAALPLLATLILLAWCFSGVVVVKLDERAVYEKFGAPIRVLQPGLHAILPWPLGATRKIEFGAVHEVPLGEGGLAGDPVTGAEAPAPEAANRLWEQPHPGEITALVASQSGTRQNFQSVSADLRVLYRVGESDADALRAAYAAADPEALVRASAGRVVAAYFSARTLDQVLGANREAVAGQLRAELQSALDQAGSGLEVIALVVEAVHPPSGAADAYHYVRAAEIAATASIASERGRAIVVRSQARQYAADHTDTAQAQAAETVGAARISLARFSADQLAAQAGGRSFLLERYFASLTASLAKSPMTIIDHRLNWPEAPVLDLRPLSSAAASISGKEE